MLYGKFIEFVDFMPGKSVVVRDNHRREPELGAFSVVANVYVSRFVSFVAVEEEPEWATWDFDRWHGFVVTRVRYKRNRKITNMRYFLF
jgi:hypothetical protein